MVDHHYAGLLSEEKKWVAILTHFAPDCLSLPALFPYCMPPYWPVAASQQTLHSGIPADANRNRILATLVASFLLLLTTSGDMLFELWWSLRDAVNFQSCEMDT